MLEDCVGQVNSTNLQATVASMLVVEAGMEARLAAAENVNGVETILTLTIKALRDLTAGSALTNAVLTQGARLDAAENLNGDPTTLTDTLMAVRNLTAGTPLYTAVNNLRTLVAGTELTDAVIGMRDLTVTTTPLVSTLLSIRDFTPTSFSGYRVLNDLRSFTPGSNLTDTVLGLRDLSTPDTALVSSIFALRSQLPFVVGQMVSSALRVPPAGWLSCSGAAVSRTTFALLFAAIVPSLGTATITIATPAVLTLASGHGLVSGDAIYLTTTGALPTGLAANTIYYTVTVTATTVTLSATRGGASLATSDTQSGVHTVRACPYGLGDGTTTFTLPDFRGATPIGLGTSSFAAYATAHPLGQKGGEEKHSLMSYESGYPGGTTNGADWATSSVYTSGGSTNFVITSSVGFAQHTPRKQCNRNRDDACR
jgi:microcystin-dependent protein